MAIEVSRGKRFGVRSDVGVMVGCDGLFACSFIYDAVDMSIGRWDIYVVPRDAMALSCFYGC